MMMETKMLVTKEQATRIAKAIEAAAAQILEAEGFDAAKVKTTYGDMFAVRIESVPVADGPGGVNLNTPEAQAYAQQAAWDPCFPEDGLGKTFEYSGRRFTLLGYVPRRPKYPLLAKGDDGKTYKLPETALKALR